MKESDIQIQIVEYLSSLSRSHGFLFFSVPNEALLSITKALGINDRMSFALLAILKKMGMTPGTCDIVIGCEGKMYAVEVKNERGKQSPNQVTFEAWCQMCDVPYRVVRSVHDVSECLIEWGIV